MEPGGDGRQIPRFGNRYTSGAELLLAIFVVIAHNVYHWIPNEVPILVVLAIVSSRLREGNWGTQLYRRPRSWGRTLLAALGCLILLQLKDMVLEPIGHHFWTEPARVSSVIAESHSAVRVLGNLVFVWVFAGFGEEIGYRGYLLRRALHALGPSRWAVGAALVIAAVAFGFGHFYKGPAGMLESAGSGLILGGAYVWSRRLWVSTLTHGMNDTLAVAFSFLGW